MNFDNAARLLEAHRLVALALDLVVSADETLAAAELEQALDTLARRVGDAPLSSGGTSWRSSATQ
ncbi:hypothetical protein [Sphingomonas sp. CLY1604]|uniref:hypothetical protein n=1 Tax=Sphingomonas sp. CLY1604 TaxID=3457786 RepID=UPI003FD8BDD5